MLSFIYKALKALLVFTVGGLPTLAWLFRDDLVKVATDWVFAFAGSLVAYADRHGIDKQFFASYYDPYADNLQQLSVRVGDLNALLPVASVTTIVFSGIAVVLTIRFIRWTLSFIPALNAG